MEKRPTEDREWFDQSRLPPQLKKDKLSRRAKEFGLRSRAFFKIQELFQKNPQFFKGKKVLELGGSPGGWSLFLSKKGYEVFSCDLLPMEPLEGVTFFNCDLKDLSLSERFPLVLSDACQDLSGDNILDDLRNRDLVMNVLIKGVEHLEKGGNLLVKVLRNRYLSEIIGKIRKFFRKITITSLKSSRKRSSEIYLFIYSKESSI